MTEPVVVVFSRGKSQFLFLKEVMIFAFAVGKIFLRVRPKRRNLKGKIDWTIYNV